MTINGFQGGYRGVCMQEEVAVQALLRRLPPLAGVWGMERYGFADVRVLQLLEALPGLLHRILSYGMRLQVNEAVPQCGWLRPSKAQIL